MTKTSETLDVLQIACYNYIICKCDDERVVDAQQRYREDAVGASIPAAVLKSRSELRTGKPHHQTGEPPDGSSAVNGQAVYAAVKCGLFH